MASKGALNALTVGLARALGPQIRVNAIAPGLVETPWLQQGLGAERYAAVIRHLRTHPDDYRGALLRTEPRWRALQVFAYQSWLWNEGVKQYLRDVVGVARLVSIRYQAGTLLFPRELDRELVLALREKTFPLLAPATRFSDPRIERAALSVLEREGQALADLRVKDTPRIHFDAEERPLLVHPGKLVVGEARQDELNRGRLRVNLAFTLPPGAYATLVVKRLFHWTLVPGARAAEKKAARPSRPPEPSPEERILERRRTGFLAAKRARRDARRRKTGPPGA
jgi:tRNA pseudouridine13 synthase